MIHVHEPMTPAICTATLAFARVPVVGTFHAHGALGWMKFGKPMWGFLVDRLDHRIAVSPHARDTAAAWLPGDYEVVPNGVLIPPAADAHGREHQVVFAGRQEPRKGLQVLLRAWRDVRRRTGARLRIAGADPLAVRLLLTRERIPDDGIDVLGFLSQDELTEELLRAKALVAPSLGGESFGMVLTRAYACATPVIASDIDGYREVMTKEAAVSFPAGDERALADALVGLLEDEPRRAALGEGARRLAIERYSWDDIARRSARDLREGRSVKILHSVWLRMAIVVLAAGGLVALLWWRGPAWSGIVDAFTAVEWTWVAAAVGLNLLSVVARAFAWKTVIDQAIPAPRPGFPLVFSAFSVGLFANAVLPGRIGELARVAVLNRRTLHSATCGQTARHGLRPPRLRSRRRDRPHPLRRAHSAHPNWAVTSLIAVVVVGVALFTIAVMGARYDRMPTVEEGLGAVRKVIRLARYGLGVMRRPGAAAVACLFQILGWACQLFAVYTTMRAFGIHEPLPAAGLVLVLMNVATLFPLWPGNIGLVQAAVALPLFQYYGVAKANGIAFGFGLQAIEASVGVGVGLHLPRS